MARNEPPQTALERRSGRTTTAAAMLENRSIVADIAVALLEPDDD
jgi:hypothetical protein